MKSGVAFLTLGTCHKRLFYWPQEAYRTIHSYNFQLSNKLEKTFKIKSKHYLFPAKSTTKVCLYVPHLYVF